MENPGLGYVKFFVGGIYVWSFEVPTADFCHKKSFSWNVESQQNDHITSRTKSTGSRMYS